jgi:hypothetical protein
MPESYPDQKNEVEKSVDTAVQKLMPHLSHATHLAKVRNKPRTTLQFRHLSGAGSVYARWSARMVADHSDGTLGGKGAQFMYHGSDQDIESATGFQKSPSFPRQASFMARIPEEKQA